MSNEHTITIIVNGTQKPVQGEVLSYAQVVELAFPGQTPTSELTFDVTYTKAAIKPHDGMLGAGGTVTVKKHGTSFDVIRATRS